MKIEVTAFPRTSQGKGASRRLRTTGRVPGVIYGAGVDAQSVEFDHKALLRHLKLEAFHASILDLTVEGKKDRVLLRDFQMHPFKEQVQHVDFQRVDPKKKIHMAVPLHFMNAEIAPGVKLGKGVVQHIINELQIQCLPDHLPEFIEVDLSNMQLDDIIHLSDLQVPAEVEIIELAQGEGHDQPVASCHMLRAAAVEDEAEAEGEAAPAADADKD